jgi:hypothetical protein
MRVPGRARQGLLGRCSFLGRRTAELLRAEMRVRSRARQWITRLL